MGVSWQVEDDPALGMMVPGSPACSPLLAGDPAGQRSAFSLEGCQSLPVAKGEQGQIPREQERLG